MKRRVSLATLDDTIALAHDIANSVHGGDIIALTGPIGAGKTTFTKALAAAVGITKTVVSPTFTLLQPYEVSPAMNGIASLVHIDAYRLDDPVELLGVGFEEFATDPETLLVIEWAEKIAPLLVGKSVAWMEFGFENGERVCEIKNPPARDPMNECTYER